MARGGLVMIILVDVWIYVYGWIWIDIDGVANKQTSLNGSGWRFEMVCLPSSSWHSFGQLYSVEKCNDQWLSALSMWTTESGILNIFTLNVWRCLRNDRDELTVCRVSGLEHAETVQKRITSIVFWTAIWITNNCLNQKTATSNSGITAGHHSHRPMAPSQLAPKHRKWSGRAPKSPGPASSVFSNQVSGAEWCCVNFKWCLQGYHETFCHSSSCESATAICLPAAKQPNLPVLVHQDVGFHSPRRW